MYIYFKDTSRLRSLLHKNSGPYEMSLHLGAYSFNGMPLDLPVSMKRDGDYCAHWLPTLFTDRELFWQPSFLPNLDAWSAKFSFLIAYCQSESEQLKHSDTPSGYLYADLFRYMNTRAEQVRQSLVQTDESTKRMGIVARFRCELYPFIHFFVEHPQTLNDAKIQAYTRLNYMIRTLINQFQVRYEAFTPSLWQLRLKKENTRESALKKVPAKTENKSANTDS